MDALQKGKEGTLKAALNRFGYRLNSRDHVIDKRSLFVLKRISAGKSIRNTRQVVWKPIFRDRAIVQIRNAIYEFHTFRWQTHRCFAERNQREV